MSARPRLWLIVLGLAGMLLASSGCDRIDRWRAERAMESGREALAQGDFQEAEKRFAKAVRIAPQYPMPYIVLSGVRSTLGKNEQAVEDAGKALEITPDAPGALLNRARAYVGLGRYAEALEDVDRALELAPGLEDAWYVRGRANAGLGRYEDAISDHTAEIQANPGDRNAYNNRGNAYRGAGRPGKAVDDFNTALRLDPLSAATYYNRGLAREDLGEYDRALADMRKARNLNGFPNLYAAMARIHMRQGKPRRAVALLDEAVEKYPDNHGLGLMKAVYLAAAGRFDEAARMVDAACEGREDAAACQRTRQRISAIEAGRERKDTEGESRGEPAGQ